MQLLYEGSLEESDDDDNENSSCKGKITFHISVLKNLGDLAMQHGKFLLSLLEGNDRIKNVG